LRSHGGEPRKIVTDKLRSYGVAHRELMPDVSHPDFKDLPEAIWGCGFTQSYLVITAIKVD
jgi:transposase-like protein